MGHRILHVIASVNPAGGGPIEGIKQLSIVTARRGYTIEILSLDDPQAPWVESCPLECHAMGPTWLGNYGYTPRIVAWLRRHHRDYDVVIVNGIWQFSSFAVWQVLHRTGRPYFVYTHGMLDPWFKRTYPLKHLKKWLYWPWAEYRVLRDATGVLFTCEEERVLARQSFWLYRCNEMVVNYGTASPVGDSNTQREKFLQQHEALRGKRCLLFLGRVHVKKGPDLLLEALTLVLRELPEVQTRDVRLVMAGPNDHAYGRQIQALTKKLGLEDRLTWTGMLTGDLKWGAFHAADAFILPSHQENFGISVAEALACGVPVLISNQVNIWREIEHDRVGFVEADDLAGTASLLRRWLQADRGEWEAMKPRAVDTFQRRFRVEQAAESLVGILNHFGIGPKSIPPEK